MKMPRMALAGTVTLALSSNLLAQPPGMSPYGPAPFGPQSPYGPMAPPGEPGMLPGPDGAPIPGISGPSSGMPGPVVVPRPIRRRDMSWIHIDRPRPRKIAVHDIITVIVDEKAEVLQNSRFNRQRNAILNAQLKEFIRIDSKGNLNTAAEEGPGINGQLQSQLQSYGQGLSQEGMKYRIAATVVDVLPNGTLILEARKSIRTNGELWEYSLTGRIRTQDVAGNNTVATENVADLNIIKREHGKIQDSTKQGILSTLYDKLLPF